MKRFLAFLMVFVLLAGVLAGCAPNAQNSTPTTANTRPTTQSTQPTVPTTAPSDPTDPTTPTQPPEPQLDFFTRYGQDLPAADQIPDYAQTTDTANLYSLPLELPEAYSLRQITTYGNTLYVSYWLPFEQMPEGYGIRAYDVGTGSMLYDILSPGWCDYGPLDDGGVWVYRYETKTVFTYDATGQSTATTLDTSAVDPDSYFNSICVDPSGAYMVFLLNQGGPVILYDLKNGTFTTPEFSKDTCFYTVQYQQGGFLLNDYDNGLFLLDPVTGSSTQYPTLISSDGIQNSVAYQVQNAGMVFAGLDGDPSYYYLQLEDGCWFTDMSHGCLALCGYDFGPTVQVLDLRNKLRLAEISFPEKFYNTFTQFLDNGSLLLVAASNDGYAAYLYDTAATSPEAQNIVAYQYTQEQLEAETARIAQDIFNATGIEILYGSRGNDFVIGDYVGVAELELFKVFLAVNTVADILWQYPEGMLREAWELTADGLQIYLCGSIYGVLAGRLDQAGGVTSNMGDYTIVALDINNPIETTLPHELSHVFDRRIGYYWETQDWFAVWESIHPFSDAYTYSYDYYFENIKYTPEKEKDPDRVWFVDGYGRTYPTEDRATLMEVLWNSAEAADPLLEYEHILEKAKLYCYILRQCFPSCNGEEAPFWEQFLGVIDESVLP